MPARRLGPRIGPLAEVFKPPVQKIEYHCLAHVVADGHDGALHVLPLHTARATGQRRRGGKASVRALLLDL